MTNKMIGVSEFQPLDQGQRVLFSVDGPDGEFTQYEIAAGDLPASIQAFVDCWAKLKSIREGVSPSDLAVPVWKLARATAHYAPTSHSIVLEMSTDLGVPLLASMTRTQAQEAIRSLQAAIEVAPMGPSSATLN